MRRGTVLERLEEEAKAERRLLLADVEQRENTALHRGVMNADTAAADFAAVQHEVVCLRAHVARVGLQFPHVLVMRRGERVMHRVIALLLGIPFQQGKVHNPREGILVWFQQPVLLREDQPQLAQQLRGGVRLPCRDE